MTSIELDPTRVIDASFAAAAGPTGSLPPPTLPEIAFAGRSNVGKSSLMNALLGRKNLVRTSSTPGCTRTVNLFLARCADGVDLYLVDLPGFGYAKRSKHERREWGTLIDRYLVERPSLRGMVLLVDARRGVEDDEAELLDFLAQTKAQRPKVSVALVATKVDKIPAAHRKLSVEKASGKGLRALGVSASTGDNVDILWTRVRRMALLEDAPSKKKPS